MRAIKTRRRAGELSPENQLLVTNRERRPERVDREDAKRGTRENNIRERKNGFKNGERERETDEDKREPNSTRGESQQSDQRIETINVTSGVF